MTDRRVVIAGGHGKIAQHLIQVLTAHGDRAVALIRNPDHISAVTALGALPEMIDMETASVDDVAALMNDADAAVFAAGAGPSGGIERKDTVDRGAAVLLADAAEKAGVKRFVQISSFGAGERVPDDAGDTWKAYIEAKTAAEEDLKRRSDLDDPSARRTHRRGSHGAHRTVGAAARAWHGAARRRCSRHRRFAAVSVHGRKDLDAHVR